MIMDDSVRQPVRTRAHHRCEYRHLPQHVGTSILFHIEHVRAKQHGGTDQLDNLALACPNCNWNKGPNLSAIDPDTINIVPLFNPRTHSWREHVAFEEARIVGRSAVGRATVRLLRLNEPERLEVRAELLARGELEPRD
jgi:hypothetical protein